VEKYFKARQTTDECGSRIACWITEATDTHSEYVIGLLIALPQLQWLGEGASMSSYTLIACLVSN